VLTREEDELGPSFPHFFQRRTIIDAMTTHWSLAFLNHTALFIFSLGIHQSPRAPRERIYIHSRAFIICSSLSA
jgi:hypothetical protein